MNRLGAVLISALILAFAAVFAVLHDASSPDPALQAATQSVTAGPTQIPSQTLVPSIIPTQTPLPTFTPSQTLLPPPTFEPPTNTALPPPPASITPTFTPVVGAVPGLIGLETDTPTGGPGGCTTRKDWKLTYTVQANDALINIANVYNTSAAQLAQGNCLSNPNQIYVGEVLKVPGSAQPVAPQFNCIPIQELTPMDYAVNIAGTGQLIFHWYGPETPRNLVRVFAPDGTKYEFEVDLKQDVSVDLTTLPQAGQYTWYVYPLDLYFNGVCTGGGPWHFNKAAGPTATPITPTPTRFPPTATATAVRPTSTP